MNQNLYTFKLRWNLTSVNNTTQRGFIFRLGRQRSVERHYGAREKAEKMEAHLEEDQCVTSSQAPPFGSQILNLEDYLTADELSTTDFTPFTQSLLESDDEEPGSSSNYPMVSLFIIRLPLPVLRTCTKYDIITFLYCAIWITASWIH